MSKRDKRLYLEDILDSSAAIKEFTKGLNVEDFINDRKTYSAGMTPQIFNCQEL